MGQTGKGLLDVAPPASAAVVLQLRHDLSKFRVAHLRSLSEMAKMRTQHASVIHAMQSRIVALERRIPPPPLFVRVRSAAALKRERRRTRRAIAEAAGVAAVAALNAASAAAATSSTAASTAATIMCEY